MAGRRVSEPDFAPHALSLGRLGSVDSLLPGSGGGGGGAKRSGSIGLPRIRTDSRRASELLPGERRHLQC